MSLSFGFYDAVESGGTYDREYTASQLSALFDGLISDGVYQSIGNRFKVSASSPASLTVKVGTGRAWFEHTWTLNDAIINVTLTGGGALPRIDAICIRINSSSRENTITVIQGTTASSPVKPTIPSHYYPLAYVTVAANASSITSSNIENAVGTSKCPFVTGVVQSMNIDQLVEQWQAEWNIWLATNEYNFEQIANQLTASINSELTYLQDEIQDIEDQVGADLKPIINYDVSVPTSSWSSYSAAQGTEEANLYDAGYIYRALVPVTGTTLPSVIENMRPYITWDMETLTNKRARLSSMCQCTFGGVYIYSRSIPDMSVHALTVECRKFAETPNESEGG